MAYIQKTVTPEQFGAKGDGTTDDTTAISSAVAALGSAGGIVLLTPGKSYVTTSVISIPANGVIIMGYGAIITSATEAQFRKFRFQGRTRGGVYGVRFECLYSAGSTGLSQGPVEISNSTDITVRDCEFNEVAKNGVYIDGTSARCIIDNNRFYRCFCAIFSDDDGAGSQPIGLSITNNNIRTGLGSPGTAFSGGIKISGTGSSSSSARHVISGNTIDTAGQMGIELQTWVNDSSVIGNTIKGTAYGVSIADCTRVTVTANTAVSIVSYGYEASNSSFVAFNGNTFNGLGASYGVLVTAGARDITVDGVAIEGGNNGVFVQDCDRITVTSSAISFPSGGACVYIKNTSDVIVSNNTFRVNETGFAGVWLDSADETVSAVNIQANRFMGTGSNCGIMLYAPANSLQDITVQDNNTVGFQSQIGMFNSSSSVNPITSLLRVRSFDNIGWGSTDDARGRLNIPYSTPDSNVSMFYGYYYYEKGIVSANANSNPVIWQMPPAAGMAGYTVTVRKGDSSANAVIVSGYGGNTINGSATVSTTTPHLSMTLQGDGTNWIVTHSG